MDFSFQGLGRALIWALALYGLWCGFLFLAQRHILFPGGAGEGPREAERTEGLEIVWLEASFGRVESWLIRPSGPPPSRGFPALIFAHGNGELIDLWARPFLSFARMGIEVLLVEFPGYGRSQGKPSLETVREAFVAAYDHLASRKEVDGSRIVLMGRSLGGGAACELAARRPSAALVLLSTFTSVRALTYKYLAPPFLVRDPFDNLAVVKEYSGPVLVVHGRRDGVIPYRHGTALHKAAANGEMIPYDAGHNDCPPDWRVFTKDVKDFLMRKRLLSSDSG